MKNCKCLWGVGWSQERCDADAMGCDGGQQPKVVRGLRGNSELHFLLFEFWRLPRYAPPSVEKTNDRQ